MTDQFINRLREEGKRDRKPCPENGWHWVGFGCEFCGCGREERSEEIAEGLTEFAKGDKADDKSRGGEDGEEVAENEGDAGQLRPVHLAG